MGDNRMTDTTLENDDLDQAHEAIKTYMANTDTEWEQPLPELPDHRTHQTNLLNTQAVITTRNNWSLSEAAVILTRAYGRDTASRFSQTDRKRALEKLVTEQLMIDNRDDDVARVRQAWLQADQSTYDGATHVDPGQVPAAFDPRPPSVIDDPDNDGTAYMDTVT